MRLLDRLRATAGVQSVAAMTGLPPRRRVDANDTDVEGYTPPPERPFANVDSYNTVTTGYVETMGIPVIEGRAFQPTDALGTTVMINQAMARMFYKGQSPIGRRVRPSAPASLKVHDCRCVEGREAGRRRQGGRHRVVFQLRAAHCRRHRLRHWDDEYRHTNDAAGGCAVGDDSIRRRRTRPLAADREASLGGGGIR